MTDRRESSAWHDPGTATQDPMSVPQAHAPGNDAELGGKILNKLRQPQCQENPDANESDTCSPKLSTT